MRIKWNQIVVNADVINILDTGIKNVRNVGLFFLLLIVIVARTKEWSLRTIGRALVPVSLFVGVVLLPLAHNLYFGHRFVFLPTSGNPKNLNTAGVNFSGFSATSRHDR